MPHSVHILIGPARSGKTNQLLRQYRQTLQSERGSGPIGTGLWLAPTGRAVTVVRDEILTANLAACLEPGITTFERLADQVLAQAAAPPHLLSATERRELIRRVVQATLKDDKLVALRDIAHRDSFADLLGDHISELQRHSISAAAFAKLKGRRGDAQLHAELAQLHAAYEQRLRQSDLVDFESRHQLVRDALAADATILADLQLVVADGFADFTTVQLEILTQLASRANSLLISLPGDPIPPLPLGEGRSEGGSNSGATGSASAALPPRPDLFAKPRATLAELQKRFPKLEVEYLPVRPGSWPALDHIAANLFRNPRDVATPSAEALATLNRANILGAASPQDEIIQIARTIKQQLLDGTTRPSDVVVVFRQLQNAAPRIREVFSEYGIPFALESSKPVVATGLVRTLLAILRLDAENWPFRGLLAVITNNLLTALDPSARAATEWIVRELQIASGREPLLNRLEQIASEKPPQSGGATPPHTDRRSRSAVAALPLLKQIAAALDGLPEAASPTDWLAAMSQLGAQLGIPSFAPKSEAPDPVTLENHAAQESLKRHFGDLEKLAATLGESSILARSDFLQRLINIASHESLPRPSDDVGRVRVLSAATARHVAASHVFLAGMSEQAFPAPESTGRLYTERDYSFFSNVANQSVAGLSEAGRRDVPGSLTAATVPVTRANEEMLLFYEVLTRPLDRLTITYPALDDKAIALPPSPYVTELDRTLGDDHKLPQQRMARPSPLPPDKPPLSLVDWRIAAVHQAQNKHAVLLTDLLASMPTIPNAAAVASALRAVDARAKRDTFGPTEGIVTSDAARRRLAQRFGPAHLWSPSQWERYAHCPFQFFMRDVLRLEPLAEIALETDAAHRGVLWHRVLATFHRDLQDKHGPKHIPSNDTSAFSTELARILQATVDAVPRTGVDRALAELDRRHIAKWIDNYAAHHQKYDNAWEALQQALAPTHFEFRFGPPRSEETAHEDPHSVATPFELNLGGEIVRVTGRIDRIDVGRHAGQEVFSVIDYKSGRRNTLTPELIESGDKLQPVIYVMAAQAILFSEAAAAPVWAGYWSMAKGAAMTTNYSLPRHHDLEQAETDWQQLRTAATKCVRQFVANIRRGDFPVFSRDENCTSNCPFSTTCRVTQVRSLGKQWAPLETT